MRRRLATAIVLALAIAAVQGHAEARPSRKHHHVCSSPKRGQVGCYAQVVDVDGSASPFVSNYAAYGVTPAVMKDLYKWPTSMTAGAGKTIALVSVYNAPTLAADLAIFSQQFGLPACTVASGCLHKVNQTGGGILPANDAGWAFETSLDTQWAHAIAPGAKLLVVEATSPSLKNLLAAVDYAKAHAQYVSMSWGAPEFYGQNTLDPHFAQSGVSFFAAAGDEGLPANYPSSSPNVLSVGGTSISGIGTPSVAETAWSGGGGGCSVYEPVTAAQAALAGYVKNVSCNGKRATPDISADADPASGVPIYDSTTYQGAKGWFLAGGTSLSAPMVAGRAAASGKTINASTIYGTTLWFHDVRAGNNGAVCLVGYDLCSGRGSWVT